jgi:hypothetical protein
VMALFACDGDLFQQALFMPLQETMFLLLVLFYMIIKT